MALLRRDDLGPEAVLAVYKRLAGSKKYQHYVQYRSDLDAKMNSLIPAIAAQLKPDANSLIDALDDFQRLKKRGRPLVVGVLISSALLIAIISLYFGAPFPSLAHLVNQYFMSVISLSAASCVGFTVAWVRTSRRLLFVSRNWSVLSLAYEQKRLSLVQESFSVVLNEILGPRNELDFPMVAPRLVELSTSAVVSSTTALYLKDFIAGHESSAVGIAGPRGSGKSTLMRSIQVDTSLRPHTVSLTAPVKYDATDFVRRLYLNVAYVVDDVYGGRSAYLRRRGDRPALMSRLFISFMSLGVGAALIMLDVMPDQIFPASNLGPAGLAGGALLLYGFFTYILLLGNSTMGIFRRRSISKAEQSSAHLAASAITRLSFDRETNSKNKRAAKLLGDSLSIEDEDSITLKDRALSLADLVSDLRTLLRAFAYDQKPSPVVILIDELDKISKTDELVETVNDLKDLFHIEGVHFIVSVSTDALHSFEQRGLSARDAFDSSFDTIVRVNPLSLDESLRVIAARAEGFPPLVGAFCYAWSGGLPRDLLRIARRCVEIQRSHRRALSIETLVRTVMSEDIVAVAEAGLRSHEIPRELREALITVRQRGRELKLGKARPQSGPELVPSSEAIQWVVALSEALAEFFADPSIESSREWFSPDAGRDAFEAAALAMSARSEPMEIRTEYFASALVALKARILGTVEPEGQT